MLQEATRRERIDHALLRRYHDHGDATARDELAERCVPLVKSFARRYVGRGEELEDLVQAGLVGLVKAIDRYDPEAGHRFVSFAAPNIQGEIRRHFRDTTWAVHVPRAMQELDAKVQRCRAGVLAETGREPTDDDVAAALGVPAADVREARVAGQAYRARSMDAPTGEDRELADLRGAPDPGYRRVEASATLEVAMEALSDRERAVIDMRFNREMLQREIAARIGVSQMQVSRIIRDAVERMGDHVDAGDREPLAA